MYYQHTCILICIIRVCTIFSKCQIYYIVNNSIENTGCSIFLASLSVDFTKHFLIIIFLFRQISIPQTGNWSLPFWLERYIPMLYKLWSHPPNSVRAAQVGMHEGHLLTLCVFFLHSVFNFDLYALIQSD